MNASTIRGILAVFLIAFGLQTFAQTTPKSLPLERDPYLKELTVYFKSTKREDCKLAVETYMNTVFRGQVDDEMLALQMSTMNTMLSRNMRAYPHMVKFVEFSNMFAEKQLSKSIYLNWHSILDKVIDNQRPGQTKQYLAFIDFSRELLESNTLVDSKTRRWVSSTDRFEMIYNDTLKDVEVILDALDLQLMTAYDTITIQNTSGTFYLFSTLWKGGKGTITWERNGLDRTRVYADFDKYRIDMSSNSIEIDTVQMYHLDYFRKPVMGRLEDRIMTSRTNDLTYPRFFSFDIELEVPNIVEDVDFVGQFTINGSKIYGDGSPISRATMKFRKPGSDKTLVVARSDHFVVKPGESISSDQAETNIYFGVDSIFHPGLKFSHRIKDKEIHLIRGRKREGILAAKFFDTYHMVEFETDLLVLYLEEERIEMKMLEGIGEKAMEIESYDYFSRPLFVQLQNPHPFNPLVILNKAKQTYGDGYFPAEEIAKLMGSRLTVDQIKGLLYELAKNGFVRYNEKDELVKVMQKSTDYVYRYSGKIDYDIIHFEGTTNNIYGELDLKGNIAQFNGVYEIPISDSSFVYFYPYDSVVDLQKNRNMDFDGKILAGRSDIDGFTHNFIYEDFKVDLKQADSVLLYILDEEQKLPSGEYVQVPLKSKIEKVQGFVNIDVPLNKSGKSYLPQFPKLISEKVSYVYYDKPEIFNKIYDRERFFFELDPFQLDSLRDFSEEQVKFPGRLASAGIFPDIRETLSIQADLSLGFITSTPAEGLPLYGGKGHYNDTIKLNNFGLRGVGTVNYISSYFDSKDIIFFPEEMRATGDDFRIEATTTGGKYPDVFSKNNRITWKPYQDTMFIRMIDTPFTMYESKAIFKGDLTYSNLGLTGGGLIEWTEADLSSDYFEFFTTTLEADTADLKIKSIGGKEDNLLTFNTPNVSVKIDFEELEAQFKSNDKDIPTNFGYNQYVTSINEFFWDIENKTLEFKAPEGTPGAYFTSTHENQDSLRFLGKTAFFDMQTAILEIEEVPEILVADSRIIPVDGKVVIEPKAVMRQLEGATIEADTNTGYHTIDNVTVNVLGKKALRGTGDYTYSTPGIEDQVINLNKFDVEDSLTDESKKEGEVYDYRFVAFADIKESDEFKLHQNVSYKGDVKLTSDQPYLKYDGFQKINFQNPNARTDWTAIEKSVNPDKLYMRYDTVYGRSAKHYVGIHLSKVSDDPMYTTFFDAKEGSNDVTLFDARGELLYDPGTNIYTFGDSAKIAGGSLEGNKLVYDDNKGTVNAEGKVDLGLRMGPIKTAAAGTIVNDLNDGTYDMNLTLAIDVRTSTDIQNRIAFLMDEDNYDRRDLVYDKPDFKKPLSELIASKKDEQKAIESIESEGDFLRPKDLFHQLVLTDLNLRWDPVEMTLKGKGKFGLIFVGERSVHKEIEGYVKIGYRSSSDYFEILLKTATNDYVYYNYKSSKLLVYSTYGEINDMIKMTTGEKRKVKGDGNAFYLFTVASQARAQYFMDLMDGKLDDSEIIEESEEEETDSLSGGLDSLDGGDDPAVAPGGGVTPAPAPAPGGKRETLAEKAAREAKEAEQKAKEEAAAKKAAEKEAAAKAKEEAKSAAEKAKAEEEAKKAAEEEAAAKEKAEQDAKEAAEAARIKAETEAAKESAEAQEAAKKKAEAEAKEKAKQEAEAAKEKAKQEAEAAKQAEAEAKEKAKQEAEAAKKAAEEAKKAEEERKKAEAEAAKKAAEEAKAKAKAEAEAKKKAEAEAKEKAKQEKEKEKEKDE